MNRIALSTERLPALIWITLALITGISAAKLPLLWVVVLFSAAALLVALLIEVRIGLLITLICAPLKTLIETEGKTALPLDIGQISLLITVGAWALRTIADQRSFMPPGKRILIPVLIFIGCAGLSLWTTFAPGATLNELIKWLEIAVVMVLVMSLGGAGWTAAALILAAVAQGLLGIYQFQGGSGAPHLWILDFRFFRAFGSFGQPNPFGAFMGLSLPLALGAVYGAAAEALDRHQQKLKGALACLGLSALALLAAMIIGGGLIVSWSRGAWLGFGAALAILILFGPRHRRHGVLILGIVLVIGVGSIVTGLAPASLVARVSDFTQDLTGIEDVRGRAIDDANYAVIERLAHWQAAVGMANDYPFSGVGFGAYEAAYPRYALMNWQIALGHAHNYYLNVLAETGIIGLSAYIGMWAGLYWFTLRALRGRRGIQRGLALGLLGVWTHLAVHSVFDKLYVNNLFLHLGAMLGLIGVLLPVQNLLSREK